MSDEKDMGPFAGMDPELVRGLTNYRTRPYRKVVTIDVRDFGAYDFENLPTTVDGWVDWLVAARNEVPEEYRDGLKCELDGGYYEDSRARLRVKYDRLETDDEMTARVNSGLAYLLGVAEAERRQYEALKAKFEPDLGAM